MSIGTIAPNEAYVRGVLTDLVRINSVNPAFGDGATNERAIADYTARVMRALALEVSEYEPEPGRVSVVGRLRGGEGPTVMLYAHYDTVGVEGMDDPFGAAQREGRLYGRGAYDMKGGLAACLGAVRALTDANAVPAGDIVIAAVADEEAASIGMQAVLEHVRTDAAIVTEPSELDLCVAHKGFAWVTVEVQGRAAHGSRFDLGVDANLRMGRVLAKLEELEKRLRTGPAHRLVGPPSLHAGVLRGGTGASIYAASSVLQIERRTVPGETSADAVAEIEGLVQSLREADPAFRAEVRLDLARDPFETSLDAPIVQAVRAAAAHVLGRPAPETGQTPWMDAALLAAAGIDTVVIGPAGAGAHAAQEWVDVGSVIALSEILARAVLEYQTR